MTIEKILPVEALARVRDRQRLANNTVVFTNGCFDLLHAGHVGFLAEAKSLGEILIVGINSDASVRRIKGPGRPVVSAAERATLLAALACVDYITVFEQDNPTELIRRLQPDVVCKGGDYGTPHQWPEFPVLVDLGVKVRILGYTPGCSTTSVISRIGRRPVRDDGPLETLIRTYARQRVLVVGDLMLDRYLEGSVSRISPEAPVPIVDSHTWLDMPGGAANTSLNCRRLGASVSVAGVVGDDGDGSKLLDLLDASEVHRAAVLVDPSRPTTTKTRIFARAQQLVRLDSESRRWLDAKVESQLLRLISDACSAATVLVISDYAKGTLTPGLLKELISLATDLRLPVIVDPKGADVMRYSGATLLTPNQNEAIALAGESVGQGQHPRAIAELAAVKLAAMGGFEAVLVTQGEAGATLVERAGTVRQIGVRRRDVYDPTGAGDTVAAVAALSLASGASLMQASALAVLAGSLVVAKFSTATVTQDELLAAIPDIATPPDVMPMRAQANV